MKVSLADIFKEMGVPSNNVWAFFFPKLEIRECWQGKDAFFDLNMPLLL